MNSANFKPARPSSFVLDSCYVLTGVAGAFAAGSVEAKGSLVNFFGYAENISLATEQGFQRSREVSLSIGKSHVLQTQASGLLELHKQSTIHTVSSSTVEMNQGGSVSMRR